jgi:hypothetical protein
LHLKRATLALRNFRADSLALSRWRLSVAALVHRHRCAGALAGVCRHRHAVAPALVVLSLWRIAAVALVHVGIVALRLGINALCLGTATMVRLNVFSYFTAGCQLAISRKEKQTDTASSCVYGNEYTYMHRQPRCRGFLRAAGLVLCQILCVRWLTCINAPRRRQPTKA